MAPIADRVMADFGIGAAAFGVLGAIYFYIYAAMQLPAGNMVDTLGPRRTVTMGLVISSAGSIIMGFSPIFAVTLGGRVLVSFGVSVVYLCVLKVIMAWFRGRQMATMSGLSMSFVSIGQFAATIPLAGLIAWTNWRVPFFLAGGFGFCLAAANWFIVRDSPMAAGLPPIAETVDGKESVTGGDQPSGATARQRLRLVLGNRYLWPLFLIQLGGYAAYGTFVGNWAVIYFMQVYGLDRVAATNFVVAATLGIIAAGPLAGVVSERILVRRRSPVIMFISLAFIAFGALALWGNGEAPLPVVFLLCFAMGLGTGALPISYAMIRELAEPQVRGLASGFVNMGEFVGAAALQPLFGIILDLGWQGEVVQGARVYPLAAFQWSLIACAFTVGLGVLGALLARETRCREIYAELPVVRQP